MNEKTKEILNNLLQIKKEQIVDKALKYTDKYYWELPQKIEEELKTPLTAEELTLGLSPQEIITFRVVSYVLATINDVYMEGTRDGIGTLEKVINEL